MYVTPLIYTYERKEDILAKNKLHFGRGPENVVWELNADKVYVYKLSNVVQVIGKWYELGSSKEVIGVLNVRLSDREIYKARFHNLTASEITSLKWDDWFIYRIDKGDKSEADPFDYRATRRSRFKLV